jgi:DNA-binding MarR family transcriptional regulator
MNSNDKVNCFWLIWHDLNAAYEDYARRSGLTCVQTYVIEMLARVPDCTQKAICECTSLPKQNVNALIKKFAEDGIVELAQNEADRRNKTIHLTEKGRQLHQSVIPHIREAEIKAMQSLSEEEQNTMIRTLETYVSALQEKL